MKQREAEKRVYNSLLEFEKRFFPNSFKERSAEVPTDSRVVGTNLARESLNAIRDRLREQTSSTNE